MLNVMSTREIPVEVRPEAPDDPPGIRRVLSAAFSQPDEADLVDALRAGGHIVASSVASLDGQLVGHAALSVGHISGQRILVLAPVGVEPEHQGRGIGEQLVRHLLRAINEPVTVLGDPAYYSRFGFEAAEPHGVLAPFPTGPGALQLLRPDDIAKGTIEYAKPFLDL